MVKMAAAPTDVQTPGARGFKLRPHQKREKLKLNEPKERLLLVPRWRAELLRSVVSKAYIRRRELQEAPPPL